MIEKLCRVQSALKAPKNQRNEFGKYNYRSCEDILEAVKPLLLQEGLLLTITDELVMVGNRYYVKATATVTDGNSSISTTAYAREAENKKGQDESQITGAASSYARKYTLNGLFCIDDTKDADALNVGDTPKAKAKKPETKTEETRETFKAYLKSVADQAKAQHLKNEEIREIMKGRYKKDDPATLTEAEAKDFSENFITYAVQFIDEESKMMEGI